MAKLDFSFDDFVEDAAPAEIVAAPPRSFVEVKDGKATVQEDLKAIEEEILRDEMNIIRAVAKFAEIKPTDAEPPQAWIDQLGEEEAWKRFRVAQAGWCNNKNAPVAISVAEKILVGITKARALEGAAPRELNMTVQMVVQPQAQYPTKRLDK